LPPYEECTGEGRDALDRFPTPQLESDFIVDDADYFRTKARLCRRLAQQATDAGVAEILSDLAQAFARQAATLGDHRSSG
jgi:hypothetical protein